MPSARLEPAGADGLVVLLRIEENAIAYAFDEDAEELLAAQLPPLPSGELLRLGTLPADGENSTGGRVWHSAPILCEWLADHRQSAVVGHRVLDLGSGTGACGLYAAGLGAKSVVLSDGSESLLELLQCNARANEARIGSSEVSVCHLQFGCDAHALPAGPIHLVLGSDIIYDAASHAALCRTLSALMLRDRPRVILATMPRSRTRLADDCSLGPACFSEAALEAFGAEAAAHGLRVLRPHDRSRGGPAFAWTAEEFRDAMPFLIEVVAAGPGE